MLGCAGLGWPLLGQRSFRLTLLWVEFWLFQCPFYCFVAEQSCINEWSRDGGMERSDTPPEYLFIQNVWVCQFSVD